MLCTFWGVAGVVYLFQSTVSKDHGISLKGAKEVLHEVAQRSDLGGPLDCRLVWVLPLVPSVTPYPTAQNFLTDRWVARDTTHVFPAGSKFLRASSPPSGLKASVDVRDAIAQYVTQLDISPTEMVSK